MRAGLRHLTQLGIVRELSGRRRGQVFGYHAYLDILNEGTEPFAAKPVP